MSGTSLDGVDAVLVEIDQDGLPQLVSKTQKAFAGDLRARLLALNTAGPDEIHRCAIAANELADIYAIAVNQLLHDSGKQASQIKAIGAHGQTVRHRPDLGYTLQINAPARLAELTGIGVVADFRSRDIAAGGQGAPLVPAFHAKVFGVSSTHSSTRVILNLGGIANVTILHPGGDVLGFDTGPANMLMDAWCERHTGDPYDDAGRWGAGGQANPALLDQLIHSQPWFSLPHPKSTGRDMFHLVWLDSELARFAQPLKAQDVQATLQHLTAVTVMDALRRAGVSAPEMFVCGGGARNIALLSLLKSLGARSVEPTDALGVPAQDVEAVAFAWLAWTHIQARTGNLPQVTGAKDSRILGAFWPA